MLKAKVPVVSVCAVRTGAGKSQTTRRVAETLRGLGHRVAAIRHPMPYGNLIRQNVQRDFGATYVIALVWLMHRSGVNLASIVATSAVATPPAHGTLSGTAPSLVYTPLPNVTGSPISAPRLPAAPARIGPPSRT